MRPVKVLLGSTTLLVILGASAAGPSLAQSVTTQGPTAQGWWTSTNPGGPTTGLSVPTAPDVPADALLVEGGPGSTSGSTDTGATAFAALGHLIPSGATGVTLSLGVASGTITTPGATLEICPLGTSSFIAEQGGPMDDAPTYDCSRHVTATATTH